MKNGTKSAECTGEDDRPEASGALEFEDRWRA
jgi:hypothetical protein